MCTEMLADLSNGLCGVEIGDGDWEFCRVGTIRMFAESLELRDDRFCGFFQLKPCAEWRNGQWIETFRVRWNRVGEGAMGYVLHGDRDVSGILRPEET